MPGEAERGADDGTGDVGEDQEQGGTTAVASGALVSRRAHLAGLGGAAAAALAARPFHGAGAAAGPAPTPR